MADVIVRNPSIFIGGVHVVEATKEDIELDANAQAVIGDGVVLGATQAPLTGKANFTKWNTVSGSAADTKLMSALLDQKIITFDYGPDGGSFWKWRCRVTTYKSDGENEKGSCQGTISLMLIGRPEKT